MKYLLFSLFVAVIISKPPVPNHKQSEIHEPLKKLSILQPLQGSVYAAKEEVAQVPVAKPTPPPVAPVSANDAKAFIYMKESGNRTNAINASSGACGLGQALPCSKLPCSLSDYACQDAWFTNYMLSRYGTWEKAKAFWDVHRWW